MLRWYGTLQSPFSLFNCLLKNSIVSEERFVDYSRLVNYTPLATVIRLISLNCINLWLSMYIISFTGYDPELYLLAWIIIASVWAPFCNILGWLTSYRFCRLLALFRISSPATWLSMEMDRPRGKYICKAFRLSTLAEV